MRTLEKCVPRDLQQEVDSEEMVTDVAGAEEEARRVGRVAHRSSLCCDLAVLDHLIMAVQHSNDAHRLRRIHLLNYLHTHVHELNSSCYQSNTVSTIQ